MPLFWYFIFLVFAFFAEAMIFIAIKNYKHPEKDWFGSPLLVAIVSIVAAVWVLWFQKSDFIRDIIIVLFGLSPGLWYVKRARPGYYGVLKILFAVSITIVGLFGCCSAMHLSWAPWWFCAIVDKGLVMIAGLYFMVEGLDSLEKVGWMHRFLRSQKIAKE